MSADCTLGKTLLDLRDKIEFNFNKIKIAKVIKINNDSTVDIESMEYLNNINESFIISKVPMIASSIISKLTLNDNVLIGIVDFAFKSSFIQSGQKYQKDSMLMHECGNAVVIAKINNNTNKLLNDENNVYTHDRAIVYDNDTFIVIKDNKIKIKNTEKDFKSLLDEILEKYNTAVKSAIGGLQITSPTGPCTITNVTPTNTILDNAKDALKTEINKLFYT